jgi:hypothetical protein
MRYPGIEVLQLYRVNCLMGQDREIVAPTYIGGSAKVVHECGVVRQQLKTAFRSPDDQPGGKSEAVMLQRTNFTAST